MTNPDANAFPIQCDNDSYNGLTKREYFAALAMQGELPSYVESIPDKNAVARRSVELADALIAELNRKVT